MKRLSLAVMLIGLLGTACASGAASLGSVPTAPSASGTPAHRASVSPSERSTSSPTATPTGHVTFQVWFVRGEKLFATMRTVPSTPAIGRAALQAMLAGPSGEESGAGIRSDVPSGTRLLGLEIHDGIAFVDLSTGFRGTGAIAPILFGQVVWTLGQFSTVDKVVIKVDGAETTDVPQTKDEYERFLPAIVVYSPLIGSTVSNPVTISGTANVFEATVSLRILDAGGNEVGRGFTNATCGTGCRGAYSTTLAYRVNDEQPGTVEVFESSAKDGSPVNVQKIPVTLTA